MICSACGEKSQEGSKFCEHCGQPLAAPAAGGGQVSLATGQESVSTAVRTEPLAAVTEGNVAATEVAGPGVAQNKAGVYHWLYEFSLWKNPVILLTVAKVLLLAILVPTALLFVLEIVDGGGFAAAVALAGKILGYGAILAVVLLALAYVFLASLYGGKYYVLFQMDGVGINHIQLDKQQQKAKALGLLTMLLGAAAGSASAVGAGLGAATKKSLYTSFSKVKKVKIDAKRSTIYLNEALSRNQVYASPTDFSFVEDFILSRVPKGTKVEKRVS